MAATRTQSEAARLLPLARHVLGSYSYPIREVEHLATHSNVMFRVVTSAGEQLCLRIGTPHANTRANLEYEVAWLDALSTDTDLDLVTPIHAVDGSLITDVIDADTGETRSCVLFSWIPGRPLSDGAGPFGYRLLGQMLAGLQAHGRTWSPDEPERMRHWDRVFYYDQGNDPIIIDNPLYGHLFDVPTRTMIRKAIELAEDVIGQSWREGNPQVVHGDLHEWNVHIAGSRLYAFDFEDVMIALPAQDIAISLFHSRTDDQREQTHSAFRRGYESVLEWPVADRSQLEAFQAARQIMLMNYAARTLRMEEARDYLERVLPWLSGYVARYG